MIIWTNSETSRLCEESASNSVKILLAGAYFSNSFRLRFSEGRKR